MRTTVNRIKSDKYASVIAKAIHLEYVKLLLLHSGIAFVLYLFEPLSVLYFVGALGYFLILLLKNKNRNNEALMAAAYFAGAEIFLRMTNGVIFYETGKYTVILFLFIGMLFKGTSSKTTPFWIYLLILFPGVILASQTLSYDIDFRKAVAFNLSGPVCLGICAIYCYYKKISKRNYEKVLVMLLMPVFANMVYLYLYTPSIQETVINLSANYISSGGYGPNQVSSVMGLGAFLLMTRLFVVKNKMVNAIDLLLLALMSYRAIITFSRGGVLTALLCAAAFIALLYYKQSGRERSRLRFKLLILGGILLGSWLFTSLQTSGLIINRYTNRDALGRTKGDITTGRAELFEEEISGFYHNPVLGIGVGKGKEFREEELGVEAASHNEVSRLLAEHGMFGLAAILILIFVPLLFWLRFKNNYYFLAFVAFWFLTINHSAMRIALPAVVYGLALLYIVDNKEQEISNQKVKN